MLFDDAQGPLTDGFAFQFAAEAEEGLTEKHGD